MFPRPKNARIAISFLHRSLTETVATADKTNYNCWAQHGCGCKQRNKKRQFLLPQPSRTCLQRSRMKAPWQSELQVWLPSLDTRTEHQRELLQNGDVGIGKTRAIQAKQRLASGLPAPERLSGSLKQRAKMHAPQCRAQRYWDRHGPHCLRLKWTTSP